MGKGTESGTTGQLHGSWHPGVVTQGQWGTSSQPHSFLVLMLEVSSSPHTPPTSALPSSYSSLVLIELCGVKILCGRHPNISSNIFASSYSGTLLMLQCGLGKGKLAFCLGERGRVVKGEAGGGISNV